MQDQLEYRPERGLIYRRMSPDNPFQLGAGRRLNKSFDQSSQSMANVDYVKNVFDGSESNLPQRGATKPAPFPSSGSKGMFVVKRPGSKQVAQPSKPISDPQFLKNAENFF